MSNPMLLLLALEYFHRSFPRGRVNVAVVSGLVVGGVGSWAMACALTLEVISLSSCHNFEQIFMIWHPYM